MTSTTGSSGADSGRTTTVGCASHRDVGPAACASRDTHTEEPAGLDHMTAEDRQILKAV